MRIYEIDNSDKSFLTLKGIMYNFSDFYTAIIADYKVLGNDPIIRANFNQYIVLVQRKMSILLNEGFPDNDPDIIAVRSMYDNLENIKNSL